MRYPSDRQEMIGNQGIVGINAGNILDMGELVNPTTLWGAMWDFACGSQQIPGNPPPVLGGVRGGSPGGVPASTRTKKPAPETVPTMGC